MMRPLHNRMPVILPREDYDRWLNRESAASEVAGLLNPFPADRMEAWPVSTKVNAPKNDGPELIERTG
jgi:putative SOS response-associated peptidase YedK